MYVWNLDRYKIETKKDSTELLSCVICLHFWTDNPHEFLKKKNSETCLNVLESIYENEIDFSELLWKLMTDLNDSCEAAAPLSNAVLLRLTFYNARLRCAWKVRIFPRDQSMHFENTTAWKCRKIRITRCQKSIFYPVLAKIRIKRSG